MCATRASKALATEVGESVEIDDGLDGEGSNWRGDITPPHAPPAVPINWQDPDLCCNRCSVYQGSHTCGCFNSLLKGSWSGAVIDCEDGNADLCRTTNNFACLYLCKAKETHAVGPNVKYFDATRPSPIDSALPGLNTLQLHTTCPCMCCACAIGPMHRESLFSCAGNYDCCVCENHGAANCLGEQHYNYLLSTAVSAVATYLRTHWASTRTQCVAPHVASMEATARSASSTLQVPGRTTKQFGTHAIVSLSRRQNCPSHSSAEYIYGST